MKNKIFLLVTVLVLGAATYLVANRAVRKTSTGDNKLKVVTTLFPLYDFARNAGGDKVEVSALVPPGVEPHSFDPSRAILPGSTKRMFSSIPASLWTLGGKRTPGRFKQEFDRGGFEPGHPHDPGGVPRPG